MRILTIPTLKFGKRKQRSQMCKIYTEDRKIIERELDVLRSCVDEPVSRQGFLLDASNQMRGPDKYWYQPIWERSGFPIDMVAQGKNPDFKKLLSALYKEHKERAIEKQFQLANKGNRMTTFLWIISVVCGTFIVIAALRFFVGG